MLSSMFPYLAVGYHQWFRENGLEVHLWLHAEHTSHPDLRHFQIDDRTILLDLSDDTFHRVAVVDGQLQVQLIVLGRLQKFLIPAQALDRMACPYRVEGKWIYRVFDTWLTDTAQQQLSVPDGFVMRDTVPSASPAPPSRRPTLTIVK